MPLNYVTFTEFIKVSLPMADCSQMVLMHPIIQSSLAWKLTGSLQVEESTVVAFHTHVFPKEEQSTGKVSYAWLDERQRQVGGSVEYRSRTQALSPLSQSIV